MLWAWFMLQFMCLGHDGAPGGEQMAAVFLRKWPSTDDPCAWLYAGSLLHGVFHGDMKRKRGGWCYVKSIDRGFSICGVCS